MFYKKFFKRKSTIVSDFISLKIGNHITTFMFMKRFNSIRNNKTYRLIENKIVVKDFISKFNMQNTITVAYQQK